MEENKMQHKQNEPKKVTKSGEQKMRTKTRAGQCKIEWNRENDKVSSNVDFTWGCLRERQSARGSPVLAQGVWRVSAKGNTDWWSGRIRAASSAGNPIDPSALFTQKTDLAAESMSHNLFVKKDIYPNDQPDLFLLYRIYRVSLVYIMRNKE